MLERFFELTCLKCTAPTSFTGRTIGSLYFCTELICLDAVQDLSRLGRDLNRTVLVDDTPLAFLRQPDNGIPIFNFRCLPVE